MTCPVCSSDHLSVDTASNRHRCFVCKWEWTPNTGIATDIKELVEWRRLGATIRLMGVGGVFPENFTYPAVVAAAQAIYQAE